MKDSNLHKWCWNRTENTLSVFYEHKEMHKFWVKKSHYKEKKYFSYQSDSIAEGIVRQDNGSPADPTVLAGCPEGSSWQVPTSRSSHLLPMGHMNGKAVPQPPRISLRQQGRTRWAQWALGQDISLHFTDVTAFYCHPLEPPVDPWEASGTSASSCTNQASPKLGIRYWNMVRRFWDWSESHWSWQEEST